MHLLIKNRQLSKEETSNYTHSKINEEHQSRKVDTQRGRKNSSLTRKGNGTNYKKEGQNIIEGVHRRRDRDKNKR
jgi:hypothetical protein